MSVNIAATLNRLQKFVKENDISTLPADFPMGLMFSIEGEVGVMKANQSIELVPTLGKAASYIHHRLDELEKA